MAQKFAVFDIDGTLIRWQMLHAIFDRLGKEGVLPADAYQKMIDARRDWQSRKTPEGFKEYEDRLIYIVEHNLREVPVPNFLRNVDAVFAEYKEQVYRYTRDLIADLRKQGYFILAISGSPAEIVAKLADYYHFDDFVGSEHLQKDGKFTGEIHVAVHQKPELLRSLVKKHGLTFEGSIGVGDSEGDIGMLDIVDRPIAFNPSQKLFRAAQEKGWKVVVERKNMIYELTAGPDGYQLTHTNA